MLCVAATPPQSHEPNCRSGAQRWVTESWRGGGYLTRGAGRSRARLESSEIESHGEVAEGKVDLLHPVNRPNEEQDCSNEQTRWSASKDEESALHQQTQQSVTKDEGPGLDQQAQWAAAEDEEPSLDHQTSTEVPQHRAELVDEMPPIPVVENHLEGEALISVLASLLGRMSASTAKLKNRSSQDRTACFHSKITPTIGIEAYLQRLHSFLQCSDCCFITALVYIDKILKAHPSFVLSCFSIHRLLAVSVVVGAKFHDDVYYSNKYYAKVCGVNLQQLNCLEIAFLELLDWNVNVTPEEYVASYGSLEEQCRD